MDNGTQFILTLVRLPLGGYVVQDAHIYGDPGRLMMQHFASSSIDEALKFMRTAILPIPPQQAPAPYAEER